MGSGSSAASQKYKGIEAEVEKKTAGIVDRKRAEVQSAREHGISHSSPSVEKQPSGHALAGSVRSANEQGQVRASVPIANEQVQVRASSKNGLSSPSGGLLAPPSSGSQGVFTAAGTSSEQRRSFGNAELAKAGSNIMGGHEGKPSDVTMQDTRTSLSGDQIVPRRNRLTPPGQLPSLDTPQDQPSLQRIRSVPQMRSSATGSYADSHLSPDVSSKESLRRLSSSKEAALQTHFPEVRSSSKDMRRAPSKEMRAASKEAGGILPPWAAADVRSSAHTLYEQSTRPTEGPRASRVHSKDPSVGPLIRKIQSSNSKDPSAVLPFGTQLYGGFAVGERVLGTGTLGLEMGPGTISAAGKQQDQVTVKFDKGYSQVLSIKTMHLIKFDDQEKTPVTDAISSMLRRVKSVN